MNQQPLINALLEENRLLQKQKAEAEFLAFVIFMIWISPYAFRAIKWGFRLTVKMIGLSWDLMWMAIDALTFRDLARNKQVNELRKVSPEDVNNGDLAQLPLSKPQL